MKFIPWTVFGVGLCVLIGEMIRVQYFTGEVIGSFPVYERGAGPVTAEFTVAEQDLPVRANFTIQGRKDFGMKMAMDGAEFRIKLHPFSGIEERRLRYRLDSDDDGAGYVKHTSSMLLKSRTPGDWAMALELEDESSFTTEKVTATIRVGAEGPNKIIAGGGGVLSLIGLIWGLLTRGRTTW